MMKNLLLLTLAAGSIFSASAQKNLKALQVGQQTRIKQVSQQKQIAKNFGHLAKTTATPFAQESFGSGTPTSLPTGWTTSNVSGAGTWRWTNGPSNGSFGIGALNSTTASDGWMILDSDSIGAANATLTSFGAYLQSPSYSCVGHPSVMLSFEQFFAQFNDSCFVQVSNDGGSTFTTFSLTQNNDELGPNDVLADNPTITRIDISSVAANQADVVVRFLYKYQSATVTGGGYNWLVDDFALAEVDPFELSIGGSTALLNNGFLSFGAIPLQLADTVTPVVAVSNNGTDAPPTADITAKIFVGNAATPAYTSTATLNGLASGFQDSFVLFDNFVPTAVADYTVAFENTLPTDGLTDNNVDTFGFSVTDSVYHRIGAGSITVNTGFSIHRVAGNGQTAADFKVGNLFDIAPNKSDTITGVSIGFANFTEPGATVLVVISKLNDDGDFEEVARTTTKTLTSANISNGNNLALAYFPIDSDDPIVLEEGRYTAAVVGDANDPDLAVAVAFGNAASGKATGVLQIVVVSNASNDGSGITAADNADLEAFGGSDAPIILMHFGKRVSLGVNDVTAITGLDVYPNPATTNVTVSFTLKNSATANIVITNAVGQTIKTVNAGNVNANQQKDVNINTANLANGVYFCTIEANGEKLTKRIVVSK